MVNKAMLTAAVALMLLAGCDVAGASEPSVAQTALSGSGSGSGPQGPGRGPPREAVTACAGLSANAACAFTFEGTNVTGTCFAPPSGGALACRPDNLPPPPPGGQEPPQGPPPGPGGKEGHHRGPPAESLAACTGLAADAACSFTLGSQVLTGTCTQPPQGTALACRPENMPPPPQGPGGHRGPPQEALAACASLSANATCSFTMGGQALTGTCFTPEAGRPLACRPANMPPPPPGVGGHRGPPPEAVAACATLAADATCTFTLGSQAISGHCFQPPHLQRLACHPDGLPMGPPPPQP